METEEVKKDTPVEIKLSVGGIWQLIVLGQLIYENSDFETFSRYMLTHAKEIEAEAVK